MQRKGVMAFTATTAMCAQHLTSIVNAGHSAPGGVNLEMRVSKNNWCAVWQLLFLTHPFRWGRLVLDGELRAEQRSEVRQFEAI